jgi:hypothetical protein
MQKACRVYFKWVRQGRYKSARITELQIAGLAKGESPSEVCRHGRNKSARITELQLVGLEKGESPCEVCRY